MSKVTLWRAAPCCDPLRIHADPFFGYYGTVPSVVFGGAATVIVVAAIAAASSSLRNWRNDDRSLTVAAR